MMRFSQFPGLLFFLAIWLLLLGGGRSKFFHDPGVFWHTVVGEKILTEGFFDTDPFTFTFAGEHWIPHQWFGECSMALVHRVSGLDGLLVVTTAVLAALFAWLATRLLRTGLHPVAILLVTALILASSSSHFHIRPLLITIVGMVLTTAMLTDVEAGRSPLRSMWWLVPFYLVWSNTHGGVLGGLVLMGLACAGWLVAHLIGRPSPLRSTRETTELISIGLCCGLTAFVTPYGADIPRTWLEIMNAPRLPDIITEHARTDVSDPVAWPVLALAVLYLFVLAGTCQQDWRVCWFLPIFWLVQAYFRVRHFPLFAVTACIAIADAWPSTRWSYWLIANRPDFHNAEGAKARWGVPSTFLIATFVAAALVLQVLKIELPLIGAGWAKLDPTEWPIEVTPALKKYEPQSATANRIFNEFADGGYLIYHAPGYRVFVDDRCELFGDEWLVHYVESRSSDPSEAFRQWEAAYGRFEFALTRTGEGFDQYFSNFPAEWEQIQSTPAASFYRRRTALIARSTDTTR